MKVMLSVLIGISLGGFLLLNYHPLFGGVLSEAAIQAISQSPNYSESKFVNQITTSMDMDVKTVITTLIDFIKGNPQGKPAGAIPVELINTAIFQETEQTRVIWFGHSTVLVEIEGKRVLIDPMFAKTTFPVPFLGSKRYSETLPAEVEDLPFIDLVILSHDHYDHMDYDSIMSLKDKVSKFYVPLGVGSHLESWGIAKEKIKEQDWWDESEYKGLRLVATPARHFSGRGLFDRNKTLWCSWAILGEKSKIFFSGDSGYGPHFTEIGRKYGPFDLTLMECGQYDERWSNIHMMPEETVQAHIDVKGNMLLPIHWAAFSLALHAWNDPIERAAKAAEELNVAICTPKIGEIVKLDDKKYPKSVWWK
jgi:L-ascorbate metabolism protein UlaG (beta-lactamase superfamily)